MYELIGGGADTNVCGVGVGYSSNVDRQALLLSILMLGLFASPRVPVLQDLSGSCR